MKPIEIAKKNYKQHFKIKRVSIETVKLKGIETVSNVLFKVNGVIMIMAKTNDKQYEFINRRRK